jgi:TPR repeat protein
MKRLLTPSVFLLLVQFGTSALCADFARGLDAYQRGDFATALDEWIPLALQGNASAQYNLGVMYKNGDDVSKDYNAAINWYILAAEQGHVDAQFKLGLMYDMGLGVDRETSTAIMWYTLAAEQGNNSAQLRLRMMDINVNSISEK